MASGVEGKLLNAENSLIISFSQNFRANFLIAFFAKFSRSFFFAPTQQQQKFQLTITAKSSSKRLRKTRNIAMLSSTFAMKNKSMRKWLETVTLNTTNSWRTFKRAEPVNVAMDCSTLNICINIREQLRARRNRSFSCCCGAPTQLKSRWRCCTPARSMLSRNHLLESRSTFKHPIYQRLQRSLSKRSCVQLTAFNSTCMLPETPLYAPSHLTKATESIKINKTSFSTLTPPKKALKLKIISIYNFRLRSLILKTMKNEPPRSNFKHSSFLSLNFCI